MLSRGRWAAARGAELETRGSTRAGKSMGKREGYTEERGKREEEEREIAYTLVYVVGCWRLLAVGVGAQSAKEARNAQHASELPTHPNQPFAIPPAHITHAYSSSIFRHAFRPQAIGFRLATNKIATHQNQINRLASQNPCLNLLATAQNSCTRLRSISKRRSCFTPRSVWT